MTSIGIELERATNGVERPAGTGAVSLSVASGEIFGIMDDNGAGRSSVVENVPASRHRDGGRLLVRDVDPAEPRMQVRHLVVFPGRCL